MLVHRVPPNPYSFARIGFHDFESSEVDISITKLTGEQKKNKIQILIQFSRSHRSCIPAQLKSTLKTQLYAFGSIRIGQQKLFKILHVFQKKRFSLSHRFCDGTCPSYTPTELSCVLKILFFKFRNAARKFLIRMKSQNQCGKPSNKNRVTPK